jgi:DNA (cytosine-5)-methyltransferase 1
VDKEHLPSNHLYQDMAKVIRKLQPRAFLFENVRGLLNARWTSDGDKIWPDVLGEFASMKDYTVAFQLVLAKNYGVPQNRPRVLMVGIHKEVDANVDRKPKDSPSQGRAIARGFLPEGSGTPPSLLELLGDLVDNKYSNGGVTTKYPRAAAKGTIQEYFREAALEKDLPVTEHEYSKHSDHILAKFVAMKGNKGKVPARYQTKKFAQRMLPPTWGEEGPSITATSLPDDYVHFSQPRTLTVREWARLQMFPDWYRFEGKRTTGGIRRAGNPREGIFDREVPKYTQIGNAVPVGLARHVGAHLAKILGK